MAFCVFSNVKANNHFYSQLFILSFINWGTITHLVGEINIINSALFCGVLLIFKMIASIERMSLHLNYAKVIVIVLRQSTNQQLICRTSLSLWCQKIEGMLKLKSNLLISSMWCHWTVFEALKVAYMMRKPYLFAVIKKSYSTFSIIPLLSRWHTWIATYTEELK